MEAHHALVVERDGFINWQPLSCVGHRDWEAGRQQRLHKGMPLPQHCHVQYLQAMAACCSTHASALCSVLHWRACRQPPCCSLVAQGAARPAVQGLLGVAAATYERTAVHVLQSSRQSGCAKQTWQTHGCLHSHSMGCQSACSQRSSPLKQVPCSQVMPLDTPVCMPQTCQGRCARDLPPQTPAKPPTELPCGSSSVWRSEGHAANSSSSLAVSPSNAALYRATTSQSERVSYSSHLLAYDAPNTQKQAFVM